MRTLTKSLLVLGLILFWASDAIAQQNMVLSIDPSSFSYPSADPDSSPIVNSPILIVTYKVTGNPKGTWVMTVRANSDLMSGSDSIPVSNITWIAMPAPPFTNGTLSTTDQTIATGSGNITSTETGSIVFSLKNLWTYKAGTYSHTIVFTLVSP